MYAVHKVVIDVYWHERKPHTKRRVNKTQMTATASGIALHKSVLPPRPVLGPGQATHSSSLHLMDQPDPEYPSTKDSYLAPHIASKPPFWVFIPNSVFLETLQGARMGAWKPKGISLPPQTIEKCCLAAGLMSKNNRSIPRSQPGQSVHYVLLCMYMSPHRNTELVTNKPKPTIG